MNSEEALASVTAHYMVTGRLTRSQLREHKRRGGCPACERPIPTKVPDLRGVPLGVLPALTRDGEDGTKFGSHI